MVACQGESVLGGQSGVNRGGVEPYGLADEGSRGGGDVLAEVEAVGREGAVVGGDVGSIAALAGGDGGAVHGAAVVVVVGEAVGAGGAAADGAVVIVESSGDIGIGDGAAHNVAIVVVAHDAADALVACDAGVGEVDVVDVGTAVYIAEEALVDVGHAAAVLADADAADGVAVAVELAFEVAVGAVDVAAYGLIVALSFVEGQVVGVERDVGSELEVLVLVRVDGLAVSAVHAVGEQQELVFVVYHVGVVFRVAIVHGCPVDGGEVGGVDADGHVLVGHGECGAAEGACAGGVAVLVAAWCGGSGVAEGEAELVAAAVVEGLAALQSSAAVGGDAADGVLGRCAGEGDGVDGDVGGGGDGAGGLALGGAEGAGVVAVLDGGGVVRVFTAEGGAAAAGHRLAVGEGCGSAEAVGDGDGLGVTFPSDEAAVAVSCAVLLEQLAVEEASGEVNFPGGGTAPGYEAAVVAARTGDDGRAVAVGERYAVLAEADETARAACRVDADVARAVLDGDGAEEVADESADVMRLGACVAFVDGAVDGEVAERGLVVAVGSGLDEGSHELRVNGRVGGAVVEGEGVAVAVEGAREFMAAAARHAGDGDVGAEEDGLAAEVALGVVGQQVAEDVPARGGVDGVLGARVVDGEVVAAVWAKGDGAAGHVDVVAAVGGGASVERLAALDVHGTVVAIGGDEVGGRAQAEGDGAFGDDALGVISRCGGHLPAIDGDGPVVGIDGGMAVPGTGGADDAAVDGDAV